MYNYSVINIAFSWKWVLWKPLPYFSVNLINKQMKSIMKTGGIKFYLNLKLCLRDWNLPEYCCYCFMEWDGGYGRVGNSINIM